MRILAARPLCNSSLPLAQGISFSGSILPDLAQHLAPANTKPLSNVGQSFIWDQEEIPVIAIDALKVYFGIVQQVSEQISNSIALRRAPFV